ncbi:MAG: hypothetical protein RL322_2537 [Pseudomonadota bacterium]
MHTHTKQPLPVELPRLTSASLGSTTRRLIALGAIAATLGLTACGGGGGSGAPIAAAQIASGTVTGHGSVIVDGVEIEDAQAKVAYEHWDGSLTNGVVQLGQHVRVRHDERKIASKVVIDAAVTGTVGSIDSVNSTLVVAGQMVRINDGSSTLPVTRFGGSYTALADIAAGDWVEVHGVPQYDAQVAAYIVQATRVQQLADATTVRVRGVISALDTTARSFNFNGLTVRYGAAADAGRVTPGTATLVDGQPALVFGNGPAGTPGVLEAVAVRLGAPDPEMSTPGSVARLGGTISSMDTAARTFTLQSLVVQWDSAVIEPAGSILADGDYVQMQGTVGSDGRIDAERVVVRGAAGSSELASIMLLGEVSDYVDPTSFLVRDVPVDASTLDLSTLSCSGQALGDGLQVRVKAVAQADTPVVRATEVSCAPAKAIRIRPLRGSVQSVDAVARTMVLTDRRAGAVTVRWSEDSTFLGLTADQLSGGLALFIEAASTSEGALWARVIRRDDGIARLDGDPFRDGAPLRLELPHAPDAENGPPTAESGRPPLHIEEGGPLGRLREKRDQFRLGHRR